MDIKRTENCTRTTPRAHPAGVKAVPEGDQTQAPTAEDSFELGPTIRSAGKVMAGLTSSVILAPRTILAPSIAPLVKGKNGISKSNAEGYALIGAGAATGGLMAIVATSGTSFSAGARVGLTLAGGFAGLFSVGSAAALGQHISSGETMFHYDGIQSARDDASAKTDGDSYKKSGAAFSAGYVQAVKEAYEAGPRAIEYTAKGAADRLNSATSFVSGGASFVKGMFS